MKWLGSGGPQRVAFDTNYPEPKELTVGEIDQIVRIFRVGRASAP